MDNQEKQSKEQQILAVAEQEFLTRGYDGARTTSIAQAAGVTHAMLHYYFRTKEQLFKRIVDEKFETMSHSMFAIMGDPSLPIVERIKGGIEAHFDFVAQNPLLPRFVINEIISRPERYDVLNKRVGAILITYIAVYSRKSTARQSVAKSKELISRCCLSVLCRSISSLFLPIHLWSR